MTRYLLDANVFIEAKNRHYGFDFCPAFWDWLIQQNEAGNVISINAVLEELRRGNDDLTQWANEQGQNFFLDQDDTITGRYSEIADWADKNYGDTAAHIFLDGADWLVVASALAYGDIVVTHEVRDNSTKIKIPNACNHFEITCINPFRMLSDENARFVLGD